MWIKESIQLSWSKNNNEVIILQEIIDDEFETKVRDFEWLKSEIML
jgi:hypothetical protein